MTNERKGTSATSPTSSFASRSASEATTYSSSFLPVALMKTCLVFQNFFCIRAITELSSPNRARLPLSMSPANLLAHSASCQVTIPSSGCYIFDRQLNVYIPVHCWISLYRSVNKKVEEKSGLPLYLTFPEHNKNDKEFY